MRPNVVGVEEGRKGARERDVDNPNFLQKKNDGGGKKT